jgi:hypothetical protein
MPIWTDQSQFLPLQFDGISLTAFVAPQLQSWGILPTTNILLPEPDLVFVLIWNVTGTSAGPGNARVAAASKAVHAAHSAFGIPELRIQIVIVLVIVIVMDCVAASTPTINHSWRDKPQEGVK